MFQSQIIEYYELIKQIKNPSPQLGKKIYNLESKIFKTLTDKYLEKKTESIEIKNPKQYNPGDFYKD